mgnify:CR=1 FL=1
MDTIERIKEQISENTVLLYMKGSQSYQVVVFLHKLHKR